MKGIIEFITLLFSQQFMLLDWIRFLFTSYVDIIISKVYSHPIITHLYELVRVTFMLSCRWSFTYVLLNVSLVWTVRRIVERG